jgi:hypothetical protein
MKLLAVLVLVFAACADDNELAVDQGACMGLDQAACKADARCQFAVVEDGWNGVLPLQCLRLDVAAATAADACETLSHDACRARADCSPLYWQDLGGNDAPVGDPYYKRCTVEQP